MEDAMFKQLWLCAALIAFATGSLSAQEQDLVLRKAEVPGADFDIVFVMSKSKPPATIGLRALDNPLVVHPIGDEPAFAADSEVEKMFRGVGSSQYNPDPRISRGAKGQSALVWCQRLRLPKSAPTGSSK